MCNSKNVLGDINHGCVQTPCFEAITLADRQNDGDSMYTTAIFMHEFAEPGV